MSNSSDRLDADHEVEESVALSPNAPIPQPGYGLIFTEQAAQEISEFVASDLFRQLKSNYALQKKDRIARQALNSAHDVQWLHYFKGMAAAVDLFFKDMESIAGEYMKSEGDSETRSERKYKK